MLEFNLGPPGRTRQRDCDCPSLTLVYKPAPDPH